MSDDLKGEDRECVEAARVAAGRHGGMTPQGDTERDEIALRFAVACAGQPAYGYTGATLHAYAYADAFLAERQRQREVKR